ncbi:hypothetical protein Acr_10g0008770 [Actinidia rufa]|uniref:Uncharacterized protein n=1 Tax=Actinidia rufa TaxID=165716 RepID=A0A7J0F9W5_9ERIC|nr:hypothetical protein Acr_10g0008770 [Actinidia rufa]
MSNSSGSLSLFDLSSSEGEVAEGEEVNQGEDLAPAIVITPVPVVIAPEEFDHSFMEGSGVNTRSDEVTKAPKPKALGQINPNRPGRHAPKGCGRPYCKRIDGIRQLDGHAACLGFSQALEGGPSPVYEEVFNYGYRWVGDFYERNVAKFCPNNFQEGWFACLKELEYMNQPEEERNEGIAEVDRVNNGNELEYGKCGKGTEGPPSSIFR